MKATWARDKVAEVRSADELVTVLDEVQHAGEPTMVFLEADNGNIFVIGVGRDESVLSFFDPDGTSFHSLGEPYRRGCLQFFSCCELSDFMCEMAIPYRDALVAAKEFVATQRRPSTVVWEADW